VVISTYLIPLNYNARENIGLLCNYNVFFVVVVVVVVVFLITVPFSVIITVQIVLFRIATK